jgi:hypothetical protein
VEFSFPLLRTGFVARIEPIVPFFLGIVSWAMLAVYFNVTDSSSAGDPLSVASVSCSALAGPWHRLTPC